MLPVLSANTTTTVDRIDQLNKGADALGDFAGAYPVLFAVILIGLGLLFTVDSGRS